MGLILLGTGNIKNNKDFIYNITKYKLMLRISIILLLDNFENELDWAKNNQISLFDSKIFQLKMKNIIKLKSQMLQKKNDFKKSK